MLIKRMHNKNCINLSRGQFWQILIIFLSHTFAVTKQHYFICPVHAYLHLPYQWFSWRPPWRRWFHFHDQPSLQSRAGPPAAPANQHVGETAHISSGKMCAWYGKGSSHKLHRIVRLDTHEQGHLTNVLSVVASNGAINHTLILPYHMMYVHCKHLKSLSCCRHTAVPGAHEPAKAAEEHATSTYVCTHRCHWKFQQHQFPY